MINMMRLSLALLCLVCVFLTTGADKHGHDGGHSSIYRKQESTKGHSHYAFGYDVHDPWGATNFRKEKGDFTKKGGWVEGVYGLKDKDGRARIVKYIADKNGFNAIVKTNEPGTSDADTADAVYNGQDPKGKWTYDVSVKDYGKGKGKDGWAAAASQMDILRVRPMQSNEEEPEIEYAGDGDYDYEASNPEVKKLKLFVKPQYDYYYGSPAEESV